MSMKIEDFEKAQADKFYQQHLPEMQELSPELLMELWDAYMHQNGGPLSKANIFNAALAIALRLSRGNAVAIPATASRI